MNSESLTTLDSLISRLGMKRAFDEMVKRGLWTDTDRAQQVAWQRGPVRREARREYVKAHSDIALTVKMRPLSGAPVEPGLGAWGVQRVIAKQKARKLLEGIKELDPPAPVKHLTVLGIPVQLDPSLPAGAPMYATPDGRLTADAAQGKPTGCVAAQVPKPARALAWWVTRHGAICNTSHLAADGTNPFATDSYGNHMRFTLDTPEARAAMESAGWRNVCEIDESVFVCTNGTLKGQAFPPECRFALKSKIDGYSANHLVASLPTDDEHEGPIIARTVADVLAVNWRQALGV